MPELEHSYCPKSRAQWRAWLKKHHRSRDEVWLILHKKHTGRPTVSEDESIEEALCFGWIDGLRRSIDAKRHAKRFTPRRAGSVWSALNKARAKRMIGRGLMTRAGRDAIEAAKASGKWNEAPTRRDFPMPPELKSRLARNKRARTFFESLAPSYKRQFVRWVASAKQEPTRERRAREAVALLARNEKLGMK